jgi:hypothetical protein
MSKKSEPFKGKVRIGSQSGLRKLARALRRGLVPDERMGAIKRAMDAAAERIEVYKNSGARA